MVEDLIKLADYLDKKDKRASNIIDGFIGFTNRLLGTNYGEQKHSKLIDVGADKPFDLNSQDGAKIISLTENAFRMVDDGAKNGRIEVALIRDIVDNLFKTNFKTLEKCEDSCDDPLAPAQVAQLLKGTAKYVATYYKPIGNFSYYDAGDYLLSVYENYQDKYLDEYLEVESKDSDYLLPNKTFDNIPRPRIIGGTPSDEADRKQDRHEMKMRRDRMAEEIYDRESPEAKASRKRERDVQRSMFPEDKAHVRDILYPPEED